MTEWTSVEDELPKDDEYVLTYTDEETIEGDYNRKRGYWNYATLSQHGCGCCAGNNSKTTHWMPLPKPPKQN